MEHIRVAGVLFFAGLIKGMLSFGFGMIAASFLGIVLSPLLTAPLVIINSTLNNLVVLAQKRRKIERQLILPACGVGLLGIPLGVYILRYLPADTMRIVVGTIICIFALILLSNPKRKKQKKNKGLMAGVGFLGGVLSGSIGIVGPPVALALQAIGASKEHTRANLIAFLTCVATATLIVFSSVGLLSTELIPHLIRGTPAMIVGTFLGVKIGDKVEQKIFKRIIIVVCIIGGIMSILKGVNIL